MGMKKLLAALLCLALLLILPPAEVGAAGETVTIDGASLNAITPYYFNGGRTGNDPEGGTWNAYFDIAASTLRLKGLNITTAQDKVVVISNVTALSIELEGSNTVITNNSDITAVAVNAPAASLTIYGSGSLTAQARSGLGVSATAIKLQYPATLTVEGATQATSVKVGFPFNYSYNNPKDASGAIIADYSSDNTRFRTAPYVSFVPSATALFPIWVNDEQISSANMNAVPVASGSATYTPAAGSAPAKLTLDGAVINSFKIYGDYAAGILAVDEPLLISLKGSNVISFLSPSVGAGTVCGVYSQQPLTIAAQSGAWLDVNIMQHPTPLPPPIFAVYSGASIALSACRITAPAGAQISSDGKFISASDGTTRLEMATITSDDPGPEYQITEGQNGSWTKGSGSGLGFTANGDYGRFTGVSVDGAAISRDNYTSHSGSTVVMLKASYLETLSAGQHTLRVNFNDGYAPTNFAISPAASSARENPSTGVGARVVTGPGLAR